MIWPIKNSDEVISKLKDIGYQATSLSTYDFSTLYTTLPHNLIKKLLDLIERIFYKKRRYTLLVMIKKRFSLLHIIIEDITFGLVRIYVTPYRFSWAIFTSLYIRFGTHLKLYRQIVGIPMGTNCAPLVADLFLFCYERDFIKIFLVVTRPT